MSRCYNIAISALANGAEGPGHSKRFNSSCPAIFPYSAKTLQHCKHTGLNQAYFTRSLIINTFFASLPGVNFIRKKQEYAEVLRHYFTQCVCTGHTGVGHSLSVYILWTLVAMNRIKLQMRQLLISLKCFSINVAIEYKHCALCLECDMLFTH